MKICTHCKQKKSISEFGKNARCADGIHYQCKECCNALRRKSHNNDKEKGKKASRTWREKNSTRVKAYAKQYRDKKRETLLMALKKWKETNKVKVKEYQKKWRSDNENHIRSYQFNYDNNQGRMVREKWRKENKDKGRARRHRYIARKVGNGGSYTADEFIALCAQYGNVCLCCKSSTALEADHIVPLSQGGTSCIDNIQPLCRSCNASKGSQIIDFRSDYYDPKFGASPVVEIEPVPVQAGLFG